MTAPDPGGVIAPDEDAAYRALRSSAAFHVLPRDVLRISGADARTYLQGQCSQDVTLLEDGASLDALLLSPQGKVDALVRITDEDGQAVILDTAAGAGPAVQARLERFRLRTKVDITPLDWLCVAVRGPQAGEALSGRAPLCAPVSWPGLSGFDLLGPVPGGGPGDWVGEPALCAGDDAFEAARIEAGVPEMDREVTDTTIAAEVGLVDRTVSFTKGCFTGQELVARLDARGSNVARRLCGLVIDGSGIDATALPPLGAVVITADGEHEVGRVTSVAWSPGSAAPVALATLHRRVTPPEPVVVRYEVAGATSSLAAEARPLPLVG